MSVKELISAEVVLAALYKELSDDFCVKVDEMTLQQMIKNESERKCILEARRIILQRAEKQNNSIIFGDN